MLARGVVTAALLLFAAGCGGQGSEWPEGGEPPWLVLRVDAVNVSPYHARTSIPWDGAVPQPTDGAECGLLGVAIGFINPIAGKGAQYLCQLDGRPRQQEHDPSAPDLVVAIAAGTSAPYQTYTARDTFYHVFRSEFIIPTDAIPADGLSLTVVDRDGGSQPEVIGAVRLDRAQLVDAALSSAMLVLSDGNGGLQRLELVVGGSAQPSEETDATMNTKNGTAAAPMRPIRAGEVLEVSAAGRYRVGSFYDSWLDPRGYPGGGPKGYNFENEPFRSAPHGSGLVMVGKGDAKVGMIVAPCARFMSRVAGPLVLGINDAEPENNEGSAQFAVRVRAPSAAEWLGARAEPCAGR